MKDTWADNGFWDNFNTAVQHLGYSNAPIAYGLALVKFDSTEERNNFLFEITGRKVGETSGG